MCLMHQRASATACGESLETATDSAPRLEGLSCSTGLSSAVMLLHLTGRQLAWQWLLLARCGFCIEPR